MTIELAALTAVERGGDGFSVTTVLPHPPKVVFDLLADPTSAPLIDPSVISYEPDGGTMALGVRNTVRFRAFGIPMSAVSETITWRPNELMQFRALRPRRPFVTTATHSFEPDVRGTAYTWSMTFEPTAIGGRLLARVALRFFARNARRQQGRIARMLGKSRRTDANDEGGQR